MNSFFSFLKALFTSKTVWGAVLTQVPAVMASPDPMTIVHSAGIVIGVAGARHAVDKAADVVSKANDIAQAAKKGASGV